MQGIDLSYLFGRPPEQVVQYFQSKGYVFSWDWRDTLQEAHAKGFTVAKAMRLDILQDIRDAVQKIGVEQGGTGIQFQRYLMPILQEKGWWGKVMVGDGQGGGQTVQLGSPRRLQTIYDTNLQTGYQSGRWKSQWEDRDNRPYWMYVAVLDSRTRPLHRALNGKVFRADDPFWMYFYPPNGWRCRCRVRALTAAEVEALGLKVESSEGALSFKDVVINEKTGETAQVAVYKETDTLGQPITVSPDAGWSYNPGQAAWQPDLDGYDYPIAVKYVEGGLTGPDYQRFFEGKSGGNFPVAVLDEEYQAVIGAKSQTVWLSDTTLAKNQGAHPDLGIEDYQQLPQIIGAAQLIVQDGEQSLVYVRRGDKIYHAAIKATRSGESLFLTSFRLTNEADVERMKRKGKVLRNEW